MLFIRSWGRTFILLVLLVLGGLIGIFAPSAYLDYSFRGVIDGQSFGLRTQSTSTKSNLTVTGGLPYQRRQVREAYHRIEYPLDDLEIRVVIVDEDPYWDGFYDPLTERIFLCGTDAVDATLAHEIGHLVDFKYANGGDRHLYKKLRDLPPKTKWLETRALKAAWESNAGEDFASMFALLFNRRVKPEETYTLHPLPRNPRALRQFYLELPDER